MIPKIIGVGRDKDHDKALILYFERPLSDEELRLVHDFLGLSNVKSTKLELINTVLFDGAHHNDHVEAWLRSQIKVVGPNYYAPGDSCYQATIGDYDLDCKAGYGYTTDEAKDELMAQLGF